MDKKPGVVTLAQVILWISVGASAIVVCTMAGMGSIVDQAPADLRLVLGISTMLLVVGAVLNAIIAVQLSNRRNWARVTGMVLSIIGLVWTGITLMTGAQADVGTSINIILSLVIVGCLASREAKAWCVE